MQMVPRSRINKYYDPRECLHFAEINAVKQLEQAFADLKCRNWPKSVRRRMYWDLDVVVDYQFIARTPGTTTNDEKDQKLNQISEHNIRNTN